jgi:hypothetical protein
MPPQHLCHRRVRLASLLENPELLLCRELSSLLPSHLVLLVAFCAYEKV